MRTLLAIVVLLVAHATSASGQESPRYEVRYFHCYLVGLYGIFEGSEMVSLPYGAGAVDALGWLARQWNRRGRQPGDEGKVYRILQIKGREGAALWYHGSEAQSETEMKLLEVQARVTAVRPLGNPSPIHAFELEATIQTRAAHGRITWRQGEKLEVGDSVHVTIQSENR